MATIGQQLLQPESGWKRIDDTDSLITYNNDGWSVLTDTGWYNDTFRYNSTLNSFIKFNFIGTKLRFISTRGTNRSDKITITIDGVSNSFSTYNSTVTNQTLEYEILGLENKEHIVEIKNEFINSNRNVLFFDAIDIDLDGKLLKYRETIRINKLALKNSTTQKNYSLDNKTLIHLPSSDKNMILHGIESRKEIKLDEDFDEMKFVQDTSEVLGDGKTFTLVVDMSNTKINKIIL